MALKLVTNRTSADVAKVKRLSERGSSRWTWEDEMYWFLGGNEWGPVSTVTDIVETLTDEVHVYDPEGGVRGAYNAVDLNRVESATQYLAQFWKTTRDALIAYGKSIWVDRAEIFEFDPVLPDMQHKTDWTQSEMPTKAQMTRYLENVRTLKDISARLTGPLPDSINRLTHTGANEIEQLLLDVEAIIIAIDERARRLMANTAQVFKYCGELEGGEW